MDKVIEKQLELAEALSGENARAAYKQAVDMIEAQTEAARELGQMYLSSGGSWKSHTAGYNEVKDMSWEGWVQAAKALGMSVDQFRNLMGGRMSGLFELTAEQLSELQEQAPSFWAQLDEDTRKYAEQIADSIEDIAEVTEQKWKMPQVSHGTLSLMIFLNLCMMWRREQKILRMICQNICAKHSLKPCM